MMILDALIISCDYNETKEGTKLFEIAADNLCEEPNHILFVDDSKLNLANAEISVFVPILMDRDSQYQTAKYPIAREMKDVLRIITEHEL